MSKGNEGRGNLGSWVLAVGFTLLVSAAGCFAQNWTTSCIPNNGLSFPQTGISFISSGDWVPGRTITVQIRGAYPVGLAQPGCTNVTLTAMTWSNYDDPTGYGGPDRYVTVSNLAYVSSTLTTFVVQIADGAPDHWVYMRLEAAENAGALAGWIYWGALIGPPPPPNQPMPPRTHPTCATPMFALQSPVVPDTWMAGESYPIVIKGTGFTTAAKGTDACPQTQIGVSVTTGSVTLSDVQVLDESTITAIVKPDATDPAETAQVNLYGSDSPIVEVAKHSGNVTTMATNPKSLDAFPGMHLTDQTPAQIDELKANIALERMNLMAVKATGTPMGGSFDEPTVQWVIGTTNAMIGFDSGSSPTANPAFFEIGDPNNPCPKGVPCPGGLADIVSTYTLQGNLPGTRASTTKNFYVPTFGMSCYHIELESDWGTAPNACGHTTIKHRTYSGPVTNPYGLNGTYCDAFIHQVILQGSGQLNTGRYIHYNSGTGDISVVTKIVGSDNAELIPNRSVARDKAIIPGRGVQIDLDQIGFGLSANDAGDDIRGYRLDLFKGSGLKNCNNSYPNSMAVGACTPSNSLCPASAIQ